MESLRNLVTLPQLEQLGTAWLTTLESDSNVVLLKHELQRDDEASAKAVRQRLQDREGALIFFPDVPCDVLERFECCEGIEREGFRGVLLEDVNV